MMSPFKWCHLHKGTVLRTCAAPPWFRTFLALHRAVTPLILPCNDVKFWDSFHMTIALNKLWWYFNLEGRYIFDIGYICVEYRQHFWNIVNMAIFRYLQRLHQFVEYRIVMILSWYRPHFVFGIVFTFFGEFRSWWYCPFNLPLPL